MKTKNDVKKSRILPLLCLLFLWCSGIVAAPLMISGGGSIRNAFSEVLYQIYQPVCHQLPQRSWQLAGYPLAVCIRCTVFYLTGLFIALYFFIKGSITLIPIKYYLLLALPSLVDFLLEKTGLHVTTFPVRTLTAILLAMAFFHCLIRSLSRDRTVPISGS
jgi:uncharacterized membrane protein